MEEGREEEEERKNKGEKGSEVGRGAREGVRVQHENRDFVAIMTTYNQKQAHAEHGRL